MQPLHDDHAGVLEADVDSTGGERAVVPVVGLV